MLTENNILNILSDYFTKESYKILERSNTASKGIDLKLQKENEIIYIEAKGETSSKVGTKNYGNPFSKSQVKTHIAVALLQILVLMNDNAGIFIIALPDNDNHRFYLSKIKSSLEKLNVKVLLIANDNRITKYL